MNQPTPEETKSSINDAVAKPRKKFKQRRSFSARAKESAKMRTKYPSKVPVIIERYSREKNLPIFDKTKLLISEGISMSQFSTVVRERMDLSPMQCLYFIANKNTLVSMTMTMGEIYDSEKDKDGFLYLTYASQEVFG